MRPIPQISNNNFHISTEATFTTSAINPDSLGKPDFVSPSGSCYWYRNNGVYRFSDHWGGVASCYWKLQLPTGERIKTLPSCMFVRSYDLPEINWRACDYGIIAFVEFADMKWYEMQWGLPLSAYRGFSKEVQACPILSEEMRQQQIKHCKNRNLMQVDYLPKRMNDIANEIRESGGLYERENTYWLIMKSGRKYELIPYIDSKPE